MLIQLEGMAHFVGQLLAPTEGFCLQSRFNNFFVVTFIILFSDKKYIYIVLVLPFKEISLQPELSSISRYIIQLGVALYEYLIDINNGIV